MNFVLDASVAVAWALEDEGGDYVMDVLESLRGSEAVVAHHWTLEVTNALLAAERRGRIDAPAVTRFFNLLLVLPIAVDPVGRTTAFAETQRLARKNVLSTYDAAYLELALRTGAPLATLDEPLRAAAEAEGVGAYLG
jgi:predicted nucleic acid-binding protein